MQSVSIVDTISIWEGFYFLLKKRDQTFRRSKIRETQTRKVLIQRKGLRETKYYIRKIQQLGR